MWCRAIIVRSTSEEHIEHFTEKLCDWAVSRMRKAGDTPITNPYTRESLDTLYDRTGIRPLHNEGYDDVYVANMCLADFYGSSIQDDIHLVKYVRDVIDDPDAAEGQILSRFIADCNNAGIYDKMIEHI